MGDICQETAGHANRQHMNIRDQTCLGQFPLQKVTTKLLHDAFVGIFTWSCRGGISVRYGISLMKYHYHAAIQVLLFVCMMQDYIAITFVTCSVSCLHEYLNTKGMSL